MNGQSALVIALHWLHVAFAIFWFGSAMYARAVIWPALRRVGPPSEAAVIGAMRSGPARRITLVVAFGTVGLGLLRGLAGGALADPISPYGLTFLASAVIGIYMATWTAWGYGPRYLDKLFLPGFIVMFTLMVLMRFGL